MALPSGIEVLGKYFDSCVAFLREYRWLYNFSNTELLVKNVLEMFPEDWKKCLLSLTYAELCLLPLGHIQDSWPLNFKIFLNKLSLLKPHFQQRNLATCRSLNDFVDTKGERINLKQHTVGMSPKKQHEVATLAHFIGEHCNDINIIIDIGSGLGYLSQCLHTLYGCRVLGIEMDAGKLQSASSRQQKWFPESTDSVRYVQHRVESQSSDAIRVFLEETGWDFSKGVCMVGLHTCGDLALSAIDVFHDSDFLKRLIIMPCCYHKMEFLRDDMLGTEFFRNFPVSRKLRARSVAFRSEEFLRRPFLRLACQQRPAAWKSVINTGELETRAFRLLSRAVLELYVHRENLILNKNKRKAVKTQNSVNCFQSYIAEIRTGYTLMNSSQEIVQNDKILCDLWSIHGNESGLKLSGALIALQACLQPVCENLLLLDKLSRLDESDSRATSEFVQLMDEAVSARCFCLVSRKASEP